jgi:hypothetical protein
MDKMVSLATVFLIENMEKAEVEVGNGRVQKRSAIVSSAAENGCS